MCHTQAVHFACCHTVTSPHLCAELVDEKRCSLGVMELERSEDIICPTCISENNRTLKAKAAVRTVSRRGEGAELMHKQDAKAALQKRKTEVIVAKKKEAGRTDWLAQLEAAVTKTKKGKTVRWADMK
jgi:hypothetical protein